MRVLAVTHVFPNAAEPLSAPFNRQQLAALGEFCEVEVWATIPWFPGKRGLWPSRREGARAPAFERIDGLPVWHPRTPYVPGAGRALAAPLFAGALLGPAFRLRGRYDAVLGSWAYPDGAAAIALGRALGAPVVIKAHGSDLNVVAEYRAPRAILRRALPRAEGIVAVSRPLARRARELGAPAERVHVVYNGIDRARFWPRDRREARRRLGLDENARWILYCGHLKRSKGIEELVDAFARMGGGSNARLAIVGDGPDRGACERAAAGAGGAIRLVGARPHDEIPWWMAACDVLALPSWNEGTPNVVLEAQSCGRPVVATDVGGTSDFLDSPALGALVPPRDSAALAAALERVVDARWDPRAIAEASRAADWRESAGALYRVLASSRLAPEASKRKSASGVVGARSRGERAAAPMKRAEDHGG